MSPEQIRGAAIGPHSDFYSLGLVLHEMLSGRRLFDGETDFAVFEQHVNEPPTSIRDRRTDVPGELDALVLRMLAKRAEDRPAEAIDLHADGCRRGRGLRRGTEAWPHPKRWPPQPLSHSSGPVEGHVNRMKVIKRRMCGRANPAAAQIHPPRPAEGVRFLKSVPKPVFGRRPPRVSGCGHPDIQVE
jgi:serine/threonine protein kinase